MKTEIKPGFSSLLRGCIGISIATLVLAAPKIDAFKNITSPSNDSVVHVNITSTNNQRRSNYLNDNSNANATETEYKHVSNNDSVITRDKSDRLTLSTILNTTTSTNDDIVSNEQNTSRLNLAVIPVIGILVFLTALCLKGCSWFRKYSRGRKDTNDYYDIVEEGDADFDEIEIRTDSASTVYYDTVSSFCSFLRKNEADVSANTLYGPRFEQLKQEYNVSDKLLRDVRKRMTELDAMERELDSSIECTEQQNNAKPITEIENEENQSDTSKLLMNTERRRVMRTPSGSSDVSVETEQSVLSDTEKDTPVKRQRFKVSFVTEDLNSGRSNNGKQTSDSNILKPIITNLKASNSTMTDRVGVYRPRTHSLEPDANTDRNENLSNCIANMSSKINYSGRNNFRNEFNTYDIGVRPKTSPSYTRRSFKLDRTRGLNKDRSPNARTGYFSKSLDCDKQIETTPSTGYVPQMIDRAVQTEKSFRRSLKKGRKRYSSETYADENVIPPTISELVEMCKCSDSKDGFVSNGTGDNSRYYDCKCYDSLDDVCDDVFEKSELEDRNNLEKGSGSLSDRTKLVKDAQNDAENRMTNHERSSEIDVCRAFTAISNPSPNNADSQTSDNIPFAADLGVVPSRNFAESNSVSMHDISDNNNDSNGNLLDKYCDKCHNVNKSVPNLCCACQTHPLAVDSLFATDSSEAHKDKCKSCSHFNWTNLTSKPQRQISRGSSESKRKLYKRESSLASEDISLSSSSLSSSGYVENSSDVSSS